ncbi:hypothetical protein [Ferroacidibacillus organovorans]|uniref:Uncharacterized protein n=1 Tax=Ferroacidibacillus organovorans TaxID=1765683 RepID=A0A162S089_9BACL|nr:hypothetical protein [Ferroacidibacillus organovorans]KYP79406.1 hypothetical protein AYJ22_14745 [Ferroacidibacillus organovorans]OAG87912.1 hypothetical protein AYW79_14560 [Ferroacidibacillus organovorans]OPG17510.1 hypothetical protein B2M26_01940 [Ferroacidibacillus organovorans]
MAKPTAAVREYLLCQKRSPSEARRLLHLLEMHNLRILSTEEDAWSVTVCFSYANRQTRAIYMKAMLDADPWMDTPSSL